MPNDALIQELLNRKIHAPVLQEGELPLPPQPPGFKPDPKTVLNPLLGKELFKRLQQSPELRTNLKEVVSGPTNRSDEFGSFIRLKPGQYPPGLKGIVDAVGGKQISLNPAMPLDQAKFILGHELGHIAGMKHEDPEMDQLEDALNPYYAKNSQDIRMLIESIIQAKKREGK